MLAGRPLRAIVYFAVSVALVWRRVPLAVLAFVFTTL
jgi:hypothetical protein